MTALYKQILSDVEDKFKIDVFENPKQMSSTIAAFYNELFIKEKILHKFQKCFKEYFIEENLDSIYIRGEENLAEVLKYLYNGWISIPEKLKSYIGQDENDNSKGEKSFYSIKEIQNSINQDANDKKDLEGKNIFDYFNSFKNRYEIEKGNYQEIEIAKRLL